MKQYKHTLGIILLLIVFFLGNANAQNFRKTDWTLKTEEENLKVYTRKNERSNVKEIRIKTSVMASMENIIDVLHDVSNYQTWVYKCAEAKKVKFVSNNDYYYYSRSDLPFPLSDRDLVLRSKQWETEDGTYYSHSSSSANIVNTKKGVVRITEFESYWKIMPQKDGIVKIDYVVLTHPGGSLPAWVINLGITKGPTETMKQFRLLVENKDQ